MKIQRLSVIRLINAILSEAIKETASDIHIETYEKNNVDPFSHRRRFADNFTAKQKNWRHCLSPELRSWLVLISPKKRIPQDGRISLRIGRRNIDVRVSTLPSIYGERAVLRLLDKNSLQLSLNNLGDDGSG